MLDRQRILKIWERRWGRLSPTWQSQFLKHPALDRLVAESTAWVEGAIGVRQRLAEAVGWIDEMRRQGFSDPPHSPPPPRPKRLSPKPKRPKGGLGQSGRSEKRRAAYERLRYTPGPFPTPGPKSPDPRHRHGDVIPGGGICPSCGVAYGPDGKCRCS